MPKTRSQGTDEESECGDESANQLDQTMMETSKLDVILESLRVLGASVAELKANAKESQGEIGKLYMKLATFVPSTSTEVPPKTTNVPPNLPSVPPNSFECPPNMSNVPPNTSIVPPNDSNVPPNTSNVPPNTTIVPPSNSNVSSSMSSVPPNTFVPSYVLDVPPNVSNVPPNVSSIPPNTFVPPNVFDVPPNVSNVQPSAFLVPPDMSKTAIVFRSDRQGQATSRTMYEGSPTPASLGSNSTDVVYVPTTTVGKLHDLPTFSGNVEEWPLFIANFEDSTEDFRYNNRQNLQRLQKCLVGPAKEAVASMLINVLNVPDVIDELKFRFGRPDILVRHQINKIQGFPTIIEGRSDQLLTFSTQVRNVVSFLKSSNSQHNLNNIIILDELVAKLPQNKQYEWAKHSTTIQPSPSMEDFSAWLSQVARIVSLMPPPPSTPSPSPSLRQRQQSSSSQPRRILHVHNNEGSLENQSTLRCYQCQDKHFITKCSAFDRLSVNDRWQKVKTFRLCFSCLRKGHSTANCRNKKRCGINDCPKFHHSCLHETSVPPSSPALPIPYVAKPVLSCRPTNITSPLFKIIPVMLFGPKGKMKIFAMFDEGSAITILEERVSSALGLNGKSHPLTLQWYGEKTTTESSKSVNFEVSGLGDSVTYKIAKCHTIANINLPVQTFQKNHYQQFETVPLVSYTNAQPSLLIGLDNIHLGTSSTVVSAGDDKPIALKTKLGWVACGPSDKHLPNAPTVLTIRQIDELHSLIKEYFSADNFGINPTAEILESEDDRRAREVMEGTVRRIGNGFESGLLWRNPNTILPASLLMAERRLYALERKMSSNVELSDKYKHQMRIYLEKGYARKLLQHEIGNQSNTVWYLPHFAVHNPHKPDKLRIVFDAAAKVNEVSLNSALLKGPEQARPMMSILFKFREGKIAVAADIREMFSQIKIRPEDQQAQRFVWRDDPSQPVSHFVMSSMIFGAICSPCVAEFVKNHNAQEFQHEYPEAASDIINKHYVDDYVASFTDEEDAIRICQDVVCVNAKGGFELRNFTSNSDKLRYALNAPRIEHLETVNMERQSTSEKVLGMCWNTTSDTFEFRTQFHRIPTDVIEGLRPPTKRELLGIVMAIFDPFGLLADFTLYAKMLVRDTWKSNLGWDEQLPPTINKRYQLWSKEFNDIHKFTVPRHYLTNISNPKTIELHVFMDASQVAFAAAAYLRVVHEHGIDVIFVFGKTRGAPQKMMSIPRLELQAGVLGIRICKTVLQNHDLKVSRINYWTDSRTLLYWVNSVERRFKPFVAHRITEILSHSEASQWRWTPTDKNSADTATRAKEPPKLSLRSPWIIGPDFLHQDERCWPSITIKSPSDSSVLEELRTLNLLQIKGNLLINFNNFSSYQRLLKTMAYVLRAQKMFHYIAKVPPFEQVSKSFITINELTQAEFCLCKIAQKEQYDIEVTALTSSKPLTKKSSIYKLNPYLDEDGILRLHGRLDEATYLPIQTRRPILLPPKHPMSALIMRHHHEKLHHQNSAVVLNEVRQKFWIPQPKTLLKLVRRDCPQCKIDRAVPKTPIMGQLPIDRITPYVRPFTYTGVDLFGPLNVAIGRRREKRWGVIFTCLTVRAVHLELAENLSTDAFIICLRNFINRRGTPVRIRSDNGTNFIGAYRELKSEQHLFDTDRINNEANSRRIEWMFNCPSNPSSGGCWERLIRIVKRLMMKTLSEEAPRVETLRSVLIEAENLINSRPLTEIQLAAEDDEPLTPNHFLLGCVNSTQTPCPIDERICLRKQWRISMNLKDRLWKKWMSDYLPQLLRRPKWHDKVSPLKIDDLVLVCELNQPRSQWQKGRVTKVFQSKDGQVRCAEIKTSTSIIRRPASKLAVLSLSGESEIDSQEGEC